MSHDDGLGPSHGSRVFNIFDQFLQRPECAGHGYLGERAKRLAEVEELDRWQPSNDAEIYAAYLDVMHSDLIVLSHAVRQGWSDAQLFAWCNHKLGRWWGDEAFGRYCDYGLAVRQGIFDLRQVIPATDERLSLEDDEVERCRFCYGELTEDHTCRGLEQHRRMMADGFEL